MLLRETLRQGDDMLLGGVRQGHGAPAPAGAGPHELKRRPRPPPPPDCAPQPQFDVFGTAANAVGTAMTGGPSPDVVTLKWKRRFLHHRSLEVVNNYKRRMKDDRNVMVVEFDNFGDIGANGGISPTVGSMPLPVVFLLAGGGAAVLWFGAKPAVHDMVDGVRNLRRLKTEQHTLRKKYQESLSSLLRSDEGRNLTREQRRELLNLAVWLSLSLEESTSEKMERIVSGALVAPGSLLTAVGTFLQPGFIVAQSSAMGALLSNLFTGFVGNGPIAIFGVINALSSLRNFQMARRHLKCVKQTNLNKTWKGHMDLNHLVQGRLKLIKHNAALTGISSIGISVGGLLTAVTLVGYGVMIPFAVLRAAAEYRERRKIAYTRRLHSGQADYTTRRDLLSDLIYAQKNHDVLKKVKQCVRERYPWGYSAPQPFNYFVRSYAKMRNHKRKDVIPPARHLLESVSLLRRNQIEWLERKLKTITRDRLRLHRESVESLRPQAYERKIRTYDALIKRLLLRIDYLKQDRDVIKQDRVLDMYNDSGKAWVNRLLNLFVELQLFPNLAKSLYKNKTLYRPLRHAISLDSQKQITVDAGKCLEKVQKRELSPVWYDTFYQTCEELLLTTGKQYYAELARELMDLTVLRLYLAKHPDKSPVKALLPKPPGGGPARAVWAPPAALPHPAKNVLDSFVPPAPKQDADPALLTVLPTLAKSKIRPQAPKLAGAIFDAAGVQEAADRYGRKHRR